MKRVDKNDWDQKKSEDQTMGRFLLQFDIKEVTGYQTYAVDNARDAEDALELHNRGESEFYDEDICITELNKFPEIEQDD